MSSERKSNFWRWLWATVVAVSTLLGIFVWITDIKSLGEFSDVLSDAESQREFDLKKNPEQIKSVDVSEYPQATSNIEKNGTRVRYLIKPETILQRAQLLKISCGVDDLCSGSVILTVPKPIKYIDSVFLDPNDGDIVVIDREGNGLYVRTHAKKSNFFSVFLPCTSHKATNGWGGYVGTGTPTGGKFVVKRGYLRKNSLNLTITGNCAGTAKIGHSEVGVPALGGAEMQLSMMFDDYGAIQSGSMTHTRLTGWNPLALMQSTREKTYTDDDLRTLSENENKRIRVTAERSHKIRTLLEKYVSKRIYYSPALEEHRINRYMALSSDYRETLVGYAMDIPGTGDSMLFFTVDGIYVSKDEFFSDKNSALISYAKLRNLQPTKVANGILYGDTLITTMSYDPDFLIGLIGEVAMEATWSN